MTSSAACGGSIEALELEPHNQRVLSRAANVARQRGRMTGGHPLREQALNADPLSPNAHAVLSLTYYYAGRLDDAEAMRRRLRTQPRVAERPLLSRPHPARAR